MRKNQNGSFSFFAKFVYFKIDFGKYYKFLAFTLLHDE